MIFPDKITLPIRRTANHENPRVSPSLAIVAHVAWNTVIPALITAGVAFLGIGYGVRLSSQHEKANWTRDQRLSAYADLLGAIEKCYESFTLIAAALELANYDEKYSWKDSKITRMADEWGKWDSEVDRNLPRVELVCSGKLYPHIMARIPLRMRHRVLLMQLSFGHSINKDEWKAVSSMTHGDILQIRSRFREDLTYTDPGPRLNSQIRNWRRFAHGPGHSSKEPRI